MLLKTHTRKHTLLSALITKKQIVFHEEGMSCAWGCVCVCACLCTSVHKWRTTGSCSMQGWSGPKRPSQIPVLSLGFSLYPPLSISVSLLASLLSHIKRNLHTVSDFPIIAVEVLRVCREQAIGRCECQETEAGVWLQDLLVGQFDNGLYT